jgi:hypothetical protein
MYEISFETLIIPLKASIYRACCGIRSFSALFKRSPHNQICSIPRYHAVKF